MTDRHRSVSDKWRVNLRKRIVTPTGKVNPINISGPQINLMATFD